MNKYWRAANYLSVGQIYLLDNPLLKEPLDDRAHQAAPARPLGHDAGPELHLRAPEPRDQGARPERDLHLRPRPRRSRHGRQHVSRGHVQRGLSRTSREDEEGMRKLFKQFSFPGGIPSHAAPETPGSIHEGGELGYAVSPRLRRGLRQPRPDRRLRRRRRRGRDGTARDGLALEQVPQPGHGRRGPADPPSERLQDRQPDGPRAHPARGAGEPLRRLRLQAVLGRGLTTRPTMHQQMAANARRGHRGDPADPERRARERRTRSARAWPMIVLRTPKGWTGPKEVDGQKTEDYWRSHQVPMAEMARSPSTSSCSRTGCRATRPEELFDENGRLLPELRGARAEGHAPHGREPARQRRPAAARSAHARLPGLRGRRRQARATTSARPRAGLGDFLRDVTKHERWSSGTSASSRPDEHASNRLGAIFEVTDRAWIAETLPTRRPPRARRPRDGDPQRAHLPGLARGLSPHRPPRALLDVRGVRPHHRLDVQPAREVAEGDAPRSPGGGRSPRSTTCSLARLAAGPQRLLAPGPGLHRPRREQEGGGHPRLPAARREHAALGRRTTACAAATTST